MQVMLSFSESCIKECTIPPDQKPLLDQQPLVDQLNQIIGHLALMISDDFLPQDYQFADEEDNYGFISNLDKEYPCSLSVAQHKKLEELAIFADCSLSQAVGILVDWFWDTRIYPQAMGYWWTVDAGEVLFCGGRDYVYLDVKGRYFSPTRVPFSFEDYLVWARVSKVRDRGGEMEEPTYSTFDICAAYRWAILEEGVVQGKVNSYSEVEFKIHKVNHNNGKLRILPISLVGDPDQGLYQCVTLESPAHRCGPDGCVPFLAYATDIL